jgi:pimeloyl-ACP methyl ester carboxylesterase
MKKFKFKKMAVVLISILFAVICILTIVLWIYSPGKSAPFRDESGNQIAGSISEKIFITINNVKLGMFIKSKDKTNPVLLILHGGIPLYYLNQKYPTGLEDYFTVVWWEQRGSGLSYHSNIAPESVTLKQLVADAIEVTNYLCTRFGKNKIYLMGHSGGSYIGIHTAAKAPELYHAYIGLSQMSDQLKSEQLAHEYMLRQYRLKGNKKMAKKLEDAPVIKGTSDEYLKLRDNAMHSLGVGTTHNIRSVFREIFLPSLTFKEYTLREKYNFWKAKAHSGVHPLWKDMLSTKLMTQVPELEIPVYFFSGIYDYTVSYTLSKEYLKEINAPIKGFYSFKQSAHSPLFEEPDRVKQIMLLDVLKRKNNLAD